VHAFFGRLEVLKGIDLARADEGVPVEGALSQFDGRHSLVPTGSSDGFEPSGGVLAS
jgi:hypothetical protein